MIRKLVSTLAVLLCVAGFTAGTASTAEARSVIPNHGSYSGVDHGGNQVTFSFDGTVITHFSIGHLYIGTAHVSQGMWHERCNNGVCFKGEWRTSTHVAGFWRYGGGQWVPWSASTTPPLMPYTGTYMGRDHTGLNVHLSYHGGYLRGFRLDHNVIGDAAVHHGSFDVCHRVICFKGHWESDYQVVGEWRYTSNPHEWHAWEAFAYAT